MKSILLHTALVASTLAAGAAERPNIVLINIDDLGFTDLSFQGSSFYETPNIDRLRAESVFFSNAYAGAANSAPSRAVLMTGHFAPRHGIYTVNPPDRGRAASRALIPAANADTLYNGYPILPLLLQKSGYTTAMVGKWHLGSDPTQQGFDVNVGGGKAGHPKSYFSPYKNPNLQDGEAGEYLTDRLGNEAVRFIESQQGAKPFFLYYAPYAVHTPLQPKPELLEKYKAKPSTEAHNDPKYAAMIEAVDANVGKILEVLRRNNLEENTLVILTSDNGGVYNISKQWALRAGKGSFYEGGIRVPLLVRWKGQTPTNATIDYPVGQIDLYPTLMALLGNEAMLPQLDGENLLSYFESGFPSGDDKRLLWHFPAYLEGGNKETTDGEFRSRPVSVLRKGDWKLIYNYETETSELYNLKEDVSERVDRVAEKPELAATLKSQLFEELDALHAPIHFAPNPKFQQPD